MLNLFEALRYEKLEDRLTALFVAVFERLLPEQRATWLHQLPLEDLTSQLRAELQRVGPSSTPDAFLIWPGELVIAIETKLGSSYRTAQLANHGDMVVNSVYGRMAEAVAVVLICSEANTESVFKPQSSGAKVHLPIYKITWQEIADQAMDLGRSLTPDISQQFRRGCLFSLADWLYKENLAVRPLEPLDLDALERTIPGIFQFRLLRRHLERWMEELRGHLPSPEDWKLKVRWDDWTELSIVLARPLSLASEGYNNVNWWIEVFGPARPELVGSPWPDKDARGLAVRVGFAFSTSKSLELGLSEIEKSLAEAPFRPGTSIRTWVSPRSSRGEIYCYFGFDPSDSPDAAQWIIETLVLQMEEAAECFAGDPIDSWHGIKAFQEVKGLELLLKAPMEEHAEDAVTEETGDSPGTKSSTVDGSVAARSHSGLLKPYVWRSRKGHNWGAHRWSCCGQPAGANSCTRVSDRHHPGDLQGAGSRSSGGGGAAYWSCCGAYATRPGCKNEEAQSEIQEG